MRRKRPAIGEVRAASDKPFEQSHVLLGFEGPSYRRPEFFTAQVFSGLFGGGMSSRLFQEVRERRGLCYAIYSSAWGFKDTGLFGIHAATGTETMTELIDVVSRELKRWPPMGRPPAEIARAKAQLKAGLLMSLESSSARAEQMARQLHGPWPPAVQRRADRGRRGGDGGASARVRRRDCLTAGTPSVVVVGAGKRVEGYAARFGQRAGRHDGMA